MEPTNEQIRKVLAEFMGWMSIPEDKDHRGQYALYGWWYCSPLDLPDYTHDLNACHEVEAELERRGLLDAYAWNVVKPADTVFDTELEVYKALLTATASERARAAYQVITESDTPSGKEA